MIICINDAPLMSSAICSLSFNSRVGDGVGDGVGDCVPGINTYGASVGDGVIGDSLGVNDGIPVGFGVVGSILGEFDGVIDGAPDVGECDGTAVVGTDDGSFVGWIVGSSVGDGDGGIIFVSLIKHPENYHIQIKNVMYTI